MKIKNIIILSIILLYIFLIFYITNYYEYFENINENIGNYLSDYYYKLFLCILNNEDFTYKVSNFTLLNKLPTFISIYKYNDIYNKFKSENINYEDYRNYESVSFWELKNKNSEKIHFIMKPVMNEILENAINLSNLRTSVDNVIIHFRCADTPFLKSHHYHFQKYIYFKDALEKINSSNRKIIILTNNKHNSTLQQQESCDIYVKKLIEYLESLDYTIVVDSGTNLDDFVKMFFAPAVISTSSSFSFMSGYFGNGIFIQPSVTDKNNNEQCLDCGDKILKGYNINHKDVDDYNNIDNVYKLLTTT
jgi:hypothetical protein